MQNITRARTIASLVVSLVVSFNLSCAERYDTHTEEQALCSPDLDTCPGWPMTTAKATHIEEHSRLEAHQGVPQVVPEVSCYKQGSTVRCHSAIDIGGVGYYMDCNFYSDGFYTCDGWYCDSTGCHTVVY